MALFSSIGAVVSSALSTAVASKGLVATGAAVLMIGGGAAVAQNHNLDTETTSGDEATEDEAPAEETPGEIVELPDVVPTPAGSDDLEATSEEEGLDPEESDEEEPAETAERVHRALTGDAVDGEEPIGPGHPEFGATVAERARSGLLGSIVSRAARGVADWEDHLDLDDEAAEEAPNGNGNGGNSNGDNDNGNGGNSNGDNGNGDNGNGEAGSVPPEHAEGPPEHAQGPPEHAPGPPEDAPGPPEHEPGPPEEEAGPPSNRGNR